MLKVFYTILPDEKVEKTGNLIRDEEILSCNNQTVKKQKFFVWKLLLKGLELSGINADEIEFFKEPSGKWTADKIHFSLSHSKNALAVAISSSPVGVDIEKIISANSNLAIKILNDSELIEFNSIPEREKSDYLILKWTQKESIFKSLNESVFSKNLFSLNNGKLFSQKVELKNEFYYLSVYNENDDLAEIVLI